MKEIMMAHENIHAGHLILVNSQYACVGDIRKLLVPVGRPAGKVCIQRRAASLLDKLMADIDGWENIVPVSGWRSMEEQRCIWDETMAESGRVFTEKYVAVPGYSEHQTGLAIDLGLKQDEIDFVRPWFPYEGICQTFRERAAGYGFIERYPKGKEHITGIAHEPWHFRYVGMPHAAIMSRMNLTLEEYIDFIKQFPYGQRPYRFYGAGQEIWVSYVKAEPWAGTRMEVDGSLPYVISGNNVDGFIVTEWRRAYGGQTELRRA